VGPSLFDRDWSRPERHVSAAAARVFLCLNCWGLVAAPASLVYAASASGWDLCCAAVSEDRCLRRVYFVVSVAAIYASVEPAATFPELSTLPSMNTVHASDSSLLRDTILRATAFIRLS
jgi:hypothetical protein